ncbi:hypothetical protein CYLTODRAFT_453916 [Cylindrobasidium torrendii FP15055 ss-10]|uniref:Uncharacterized protein n=1 Tax=Cylindrobasidium torrendii FP15055 ss-10 TaxID=1314674 RepID=A0A0D7BBZ2_9AGAR|nr:hypothetical protein CYLTODRAFT_453916 [Cylindrobasidium torrendii FP15055 ss-10]
MSLPPSIQDQDHLANNGMAFVHAVISLMCESVWWSVYLVFFVYATKLQIYRGIRTVPSMVMFIITVVLFGASTSLWAMNATVLIQKLRYLLIDYPALALSERIARSNKRILPFALPMKGLFLSNMIIGDTVIIWRVWALWQDGASRTRWLVAIPIAFLCVSYGFAVNALKCLSEETFIESTVAGGGRLCAWTESISWGVSLLTNLTSTILIAIKAWQVRRFLKAKCRECNKTMTERVLILLVDSGFIYCFFWLSQLILFFKFDANSKTAYLYDILSNIGDQFSGLYPTIMIILVNKQHSLSDGLPNSMCIESGYRRRIESYKPSTAQLDGYTMPVLSRGSTRDTAPALNRTASVGLWALMSWRVMRCDFQ